MNQNDRSIAHAISSEIESSYNRFLRNVELKIGQNSVEPLKSGYGKLLLLSGILDVIFFAIGELHKEIAVNNVKVELVGKFREQYGQAIDWVLKKFTDFAEQFAGVAFNSSVLGPVVARAMIVEAILFQHVYSKKITDSDFAVIRYQFEDEMKNVFESVVKVFKGGKDSHLAMDTNMEAAEGSVQDDENEIHKSSCDDNRTCSPRKAIIIENEIPNRQETFFKMEKLRNAKSFEKYLQLFILAPLSIKTATVFIVLQIGLDLISRIDGDGQNKGTAYAFAAITLWLLAGILKGYNHCRWGLIGLRAFCLLLIPVSYFASTNVQHQWVSDFWGSILWHAILTVVTALPYIIALAVPSANQWFKGYVRDIEKLRNYADNSERPKYLHTAIATVLIFLFFGFIALGHVFLSRENKSTDADRIRAEAVVMESISNDHLNRATKNKFGEVLEDVDLLFARKNVEHTKWRISDAKDFLQHTINRASAELNRHRELGDKSKEYREFNEMRKSVITMALDFYHAELDVVEQAEKIFYSSLLLSKECPEEEKQHLALKYGKYMYYSTSKVELQKLIDLNSRMLKKASELTEKSKTL